MFCTMVLHIYDRSFDETSVKLFIYSLHAVELISCMILSERQESLLKMSLLARQYFCSFFFFYFLLWCLGSPHFFDRQYLMENCATTNYILLLTSKSSLLIDLFLNKVDSGDYFVVTYERSSQIESEQVDDDVDIDRIYEGVNSQSDSKKNNDIPAAQSSDLLKPEDARSEKIASGPKSNPTSNVKEELHSVTIDTCNKIRTEHVLTSTDVVSDLVYNSVPRLSFCLFFLCASSSLYLLDWGEKWQKWPIITISGAFIGSLIDDVIYITR